VIKRIVTSLAAIVFVSIVALVPAAPSAALFPGGPSVNPNNPGGGNNGGGTPAGDCGGNGVAGFLGFRAWDACLAHDATGTPQITALEDVWRIAIIVVEFFIKIGGYLAAGFIIWGGIKYLKSQGEPGETAQARQIINNALLGLVISLMSVAIVQFIAGAF
jgi:hypothetical protein